MPEVRLIDANAAADKIMHDVEVHADEIGIGAIAIMIAFARALRDETDFPTIEPEVRHGRWLSYTGTHYTGKENEYGDPEYKEHIFFVCSDCRRKTVVRENFCPNCGARMDATGTNAGGKGGNG